MSFVRNAWYVAGWSRDFGDALMSLEITSRQIVMFRDSAGEVRALEDRCPHRQLPLSKGKRIGDTIQCGYHGMTFDGFGQADEVDRFAQECVLTAILVRAFDRHRREAGKQFTHRPSMRIRASRCLTAQRVFKQRIGKDRPLHTVTRFKVTPAPFFNTPVYRRFICRLGPVERKPGPLCSPLRRQRFSPANQRRLDFASSDHLEQPVHTPLRHIATRPGIDQPFCSAITDAPRDRGRRIGRPAKRTGEPPRGVGE